MERQFQEAQKRESLGVLAGFIQKPYEYLTLIDTLGQILPSD